MKMFGSKKWRVHGVSRVFTAIASRAYSSSSLSLYQRISSFGDRTVSIVPVLDRWVDGGSADHQSELLKTIKQLRQHRRFSQALQISEWMSDRKKYDLSAGDIAVRLDLTSKVHGLHKAEEYFNSIPLASRVDKVHGSLLNCYAEKRSVEKAEEVFQKMKELGFVRYSLTYNVLLSLYSVLGKHEKVKTLLKEMEEDSIQFDKTTLNIQLKCCIATNDTEGMEKLLAKTEVDPSTFNSHTYFIAAEGYLKAGFLEKALTMLRKSEEVISSTRKRIEYEKLFILYASAGKNDEVYRIWNLYKQTGKVYNSGYLSMLTSLLKLDDIDGAEKVFKAWESSHASFDGQIVSYLISEYCKKGHLGKALLCADRLAQSGKEPDSSTWQCLANQCCKEGSMVNAVETMKKAALAKEPKWSVKLSTLRLCLKYLKNEGNLEAAQEILELLRESDSLSKSEYSSSVEYLNSGEETGEVDAVLKQNKKHNKKQVRENAVDGIAETS